jgi:hypothetical protein
VKRTQAATPQPRTPTRSHEQSTPRQPQPAAIGQASTRGRTAFSFLPSFHSSFFFLRVLALGVFVFAAGTIDGDGDD